MRKTILLAAFLLAASSLSASDDPIRIFISDSSSWSVGGSGFANSSGGAGAVSGGARPQTVEIMKTFRKRCPEVTVTINQDRADFIVFLDHEGGKDIISKDNKVAVFDREGDMLFAKSTRSLGNAVKDACKVIRENTGLAAD